MTTHPSSTPRHWRSFAGTLALTLFAVLAGCTDDSVTPPTLDASFVGYSNPATKQTTCGNCHISKQRTWVTTAHARAWDDLQGSGQAQSSCNSCHTTNGSSNLAPDSAGFTSAAADAKPFYYDVQCESCHGPGAGHISAPDDGQPLSTIIADTASAFGCATCHTGAHNPFVEQWRGSAHGAVHAGTEANASCQGCHTGQGALARFDSDAKYLEKGSSVATPITCAVCHDPHGSDNPSQLRLPVGAPNMETNLCMQCHQRRSVPDPTSSRGPHSPQGPMVLGEAGYIPPNFVYDATRAGTSHGTEANPRLCATCHMEAFNVTDAATGAFQMRSTGHSFKAVPCVDANGAPTDSTTCPDTERRFNACASGGCHSSTAIASNLRLVLRGRLQAQIDVLWKDKDGDGVLDALPTDSGLLAIAKLNTPCDFSVTTTVATTGPCTGLPAGSTVISVGEGAWFNVDMIQRGDGSFGVHNPIYAEALLLGSTSALRVQYPYLPTPPAGVQAQINARMQRLGMHPQPVARR
jgi:predicted CXXCH cytochrome family protein